MDLGLVETNGLAASRGGRRSSIVRIASHLRFVGIDIGATSVDGDRTTDPPGVGNGYSIVPFGDPRSDIDFERFYGRIGAKGFHNSNYEQDNAPGGAADPGKSLRDTIISARNMANLRG